MRWIDTATPVAEVNAPSLVSRIVEVRTVPSASLTSLMSLTL
jgi:hypothetical protein